MTDVTPLLHWTQNTDTVKPAGSRFRQAATEKELAALKKAWDVLDVGALEVDFEIKPWRKTGFRVTGTISGDVTQACVVTLEPVRQDIRLEISETFLPEEEAERLARKLEEQGEIVVDVEAQDPPDAYRGNSLPVGSLAAQHFALAMDDYPRKPGAEFESAAEEAEETADEKPSPFAALANHALAKRDKGGED